MQQAATQQVATKEPPTAEQNGTAANAAALPDLPYARPLDDDANGQPLTLEADTESHHGDISTLEGNVVITLRNRTVRADRITYDAATGNVTADGHFRVSGADNGEYIEASHGIYNLNTQLGRFYDVNGSVGLHAAPKRMHYESPNPFLFSGRLVVKTGPVNYDVYDGKVTSCLLPNPDWQLSSSHFSLDGDKARAYNSTFRLVRTPILFLPYVTHPIDAEQRQSGFLVPVISQSTTKGFIFGEQFYLVLGRSADLTVGFEYFTRRGYSESGTFRYRGAGNDFLSAHFSALQDRGYIDSTSGLLVNQGGEDVTAAFRRRLNKTTRVVGDVEYLSNYVYREAFNENFNQAVSSDITSVLYVVNQQHGFATALRADRYQGLKRVPVGTQPGQQVRIFHAPSLDFTAVDHHIGNTPLLWSVTSSVAGLKRSQPNFISSGIMQRFDFRPEISLPLAGGGWHMLSSIAVRETVASRSRAVPYVNSQPPVELTEPVNRASAEVEVDIRPPAIERDFKTPAFAERLLGPRLRHVVEPQLVYRNTAGIGNFLSLLRYDAVDIDSNTNELEYGVTQRLFAARRKPATPDPCSEAIDAASEPQGAEPADSDGTPSGLDANGIPTPEAAPLPQRTHAHGAHGTPACTPAEPKQQEWLSWRLAQKHFFDSTFGQAVLNGRRNIFDTTLSFSGIAFLTEARDISPLLSRFRMRTSSHSDIEWDFDLDTGAKKFTSSNVFIDAHEGPYFGAISYARLNAPGRFYTETIDNNAVNTPTLTSNAVSDFSQMRVLLGYGTPTKPGLSAAANAGIDLNVGSLQYGSLQASYNWNCCGLSVEYRKYELGSVRNEGSYRFNFTLANIGTAGNLRHSERLF